MGWGGDYSGIRRGLQWDGGETIVGWGGGGTIVGWGRDHSGMGKGDHSGMGGGGRKEGL